MGARERGGLRHIGQHLTGPAADPSDAWFSRGALQQLRAAVDHRLSGSTDDPHEGLQEACRRLRAEAQAKDLGPTDLVKAVREASAQTVHGQAWEKTPDLRYYRLLDDCLTAFFEENGTPHERA